MEESFRLPRNTNADTPSRLAVCQRRETHSQLSQKIIEERLEYYRTPRKLIEEDLFPETREFWQEELSSSEQKRNQLWQIDDGIGIKINPESEIVKQAITYNRNIQHNLGIDDKILPADLTSNSETQPEEKNKATQPKRIRRSGSVGRLDILRNINRLNPIGYEPDHQKSSFDEGERQPRSRSIESQRMNENSKKLNIDSASDSEKPGFSKSSLFRKLAAYKKESEIDTIGVMTEESQKDTHSSANTSIEQQHPPMQYSPLLGRESVARLLKPSRFNSLRSSSVKSEKVLPLKINNENDESTVGTKSTSKPTTNNIFDWKSENPETGNGKKALEREGRRKGLIKSSSFKVKPTHSISLPPIKQNKTRVTDVTRTKVLTHGDDHDADRLIHDK
mgnify:FL=1